mgnify:CR=1 FL=1
MTYSWCVPFIFRLFLIVNCLLLTSLPCKGRGVGDRSAVALVAHEQGGAGDEEYGEQRHHQHGRRAPAQRVEVALQVSKVGVGLVIPPDYAVRLRQGKAQVSLILDGSDPTVANIALSAAQLIAAPLWGRLSDRIGRRPVLLGTLIGMTVGSVALASWLLRSSCVWVIFPCNTSAWACHWALVSASFFAASA